MEYTASLSSQRSQIYDDHRDIKQILGMITRRPGLLKLICDTLVVILDGIDNKKYRKAAVKLCQKLNKKN